MAKVRDMIEQWLIYAKKNNIKTDTTEGRQPEDTDLASFLTKQGWDSEVFQPLIDKIPDAEDAPEDEVEPEVSAEIDASNADIPRGERAVASNKKRYVWNNKRWLDDTTLEPADNEIQQELIDKYEKQDEPEPAPYHDIRPKVKTSIPKRAKNIASDGNRYVWTGRKWLDDETFDQAPQEIQDELSKKYPAGSRPSSPKQEPEARRAPKQAPEPKGSSNDEIPGSEPASRAPIDDKSQQQLEKIKSLIDNMSRKQQKQLKRELSNG